MAFEGLGAARSSCCWRSGCSGDAGRNRGSYGDPEYRLLCRVDTRRDIANRAARRTQLMTWVTLTRANDLLGSSGRQSFDGSQTHQTDGEYARQVRCSIPLFDVGDAYLAFAPNRSVRTDSAGCPACSKSEDADSTKLSPPQTKALLATPPRRSICARTCGS